MLDSMILGRLVDFEENDVDQCDLNTESLYLYDQSCLLKSVKVKTSKPDILYYYDVLSEAPNNLWLILLRNIIEHYSLNSLKPLLTNEFSTGLSKEVRVLFFFIKIKLLDMLDDLRIEDNYSKESVLELVKKVALDNKTSPLFRYAIYYIDTESIIKFVVTLMNEQYHLGEDYE